MTLLSGGQSDQLAVAESSVIYANVPEQNALRRLEQLSHELHKVATIPDAKRLIEAAEALAMAARAMNVCESLRRDSEALVARCTRRLGEITALIPKSGATRGRGVPTKTETLRESGVDLTKARRAEAIASIPHQEFESLLQEEPTPTVNGLLRKIGFPDVKRIDGNWTVRKRAIALATDAVKLIQKLAAEKRPPTPGEARDLTRRLSEVRT